MALKTFRVNTENGFIFPGFLNRVGGRVFDAVVEADGTFSILNTRMRFTDPETAPPPGTTIKFWLDRYFHCADTADYLEQEREREERRRSEAEAARLRDNARRVEAERFNASLRIPVAWCVAIKDVLSGLSESSWGDGRNRATVEHVMLLEELATGRLHRQKGDFLCGNSKSRWGARWRDPAEIWRDGDGKGYQPKITCKKCLAMAARFRSPTADDAADKE